MTPTDRHPPPPLPRGPAGRVPPLDSHTHDAHHVRHGHADHDGLYNEEVAHEETDVNVRQLIAYAIGLVAMCLVSGAIVLVLFNVFEGQAATNDPVLPQQMLPAGQLPPEPRLILNEPLVLKKHRDTEAEMLEKYGWVNQATGVARVPIEEAKKMLLHNGLPVRPGPPGDLWMGTHSPARGESSSGRAIPVRPAAKTAAPPAVEPTAPAAGGQKAPGGEHKGGG
ncbi:MAG: hypothetical protein ABIP65_06190 [Vicinamibacterales bacterium]